MDICAINRPGSVRPADVNVLVQGLSPLPPWGIRWHRCREQRERAASPSMPLARGGFLSAWPGLEVGREEALEDREVTKPTHGPDSYRVLRTRSQPAPHRAVLPTQGDFRKLLLIEVKQEMKQVRIRIPTRVFARERAGTEIAGRLGSKEHRKEAEREEAAAGGSAALLYYWRTGDGAAKGAGRTCWEQAGAGFARGLSLQSTARPASLAGRGWGDGGFGRDLRLQRNLPGPPLPRARQAYSMLEACACKGEAHYLVPPPQIPSPGGRYYR